MRNRWVNVSRVVVATALLAAGASAAHAEENLVAATVPFPFVVGKTVLPAGAYVVRQPLDDPGVVSILTADGRHVANTITIAGSTDQFKTQQPALVFKKLDGRYFLERITSVDGIERDLVLKPAQTEHEIAVAGQNQ
jgi:hypothetical protein